MEATFDERCGLHSSWGLLGAILGLSWGHLGAILAPLETLLGATWGLLGPILGPKPFQGATKTFKIDVKVHLHVTTPARDALQVGFALFFTGFSAPGGGVPWGGSSLGGGPPSPDPSPRVSIPVSDPVSDPESPSQSQAQSLHPSLRLVDYPPHAGPEVGGFRPCDKT